MGGAVSGIGNAVSGVIGGIGANKAAKQQIKSNNAAQDMQWQMYREQLGMLEPYRDAGGTALAGLQGLVNNRGGTLADYYNSQEFSDLSNQARYQQLASSEATGGLGSTATSNALSAIAPALGQNFMNTQYNNLMGLTDVGLRGAGASSEASGNNANSLISLLQQQGAIKGGKAALPWQVGASANSSMSNGAGQDLNTAGNMFSNFFKGLY